MAFIPAPSSTIRLVFQQTLQGQDVINGLHVEVDNDTYTGAQLVGLANDVGALWATTVNDNVSDELSLNQVVATQVDLANMAQGISTTGPWLGAETAQASASNMMCMLASLRTGLTGRSFRGRWYQAGWRASEIDTDSSLWKAPGVAEFALDFQAFLDGIAALTIDSSAIVPVITSYYHQVGGVTVPRALAVNTPIESVTARRTIAVQRRRRPAFT